MKTQQLQNVSTRYTVMPITQPQHQKKLKNYMTSSHHQKTSFCRFYLRGICIMKPKLCKFAHSFDQLVIQQNEQQYQTDLAFTSKERKKKYFEQRQDFQQKALFLLRNVDYNVLYQYQFSQKWQSSKFNTKLYSFEQIKKDQGIRHRIRQVLHRQNWQKLIYYLLNKFPHIDFTISFLSKWFSKVGFEKPQTRCKFNDFIRYMTNVHQFKEIYLIVPPRTQKAVYLINCNDKYPRTVMAENIKQIQQQFLKAKQEYKKQQAKLQPLPQKMYKRYICRYYMSGSCHLMSQQCVYAHSIKQLKFQLGQKFQPIYKQTNKGRQQQRVNFVSLYRYSLENIDPNITLQQMNQNNHLRNQYRRKMHLSLFSDFMDLLMQLSGKDKFQLKFISTEYYGAGFNHTQQNKFGQFQSGLTQIGYFIQDVKHPQQSKATYVYKVPPIQKLDIYFDKLINEILLQQVSIIESARKKQTQEKMKQLQLRKLEYSKNYQFLDQQQQQQRIRQLQNQLQALQIQKPRQLILQSSFRKKIYRYQQSFNIPLHIYLKLKNQSLQQIIKSLTKNKQYLDHIFFETNQQNYRKLIQICKGYLKDKKDYVFRLENIQLNIKNMQSDKINLNTFVNFKGLLQSAVLDAGKKVYFLSFGNNVLVVDKGNLCLHEKNVVKGKYGLKDYESKQLENIKSNPLNKQRIIVVDSLETQLYAEQFLKNCNRLGVDLQGRLRKQGYIDLVQVSGICSGQKQIFVFDIFTVNRFQDKSLYERARVLLKELFQDPNRVKILHDCRQDSIAVKYLMDINLRNVFDTAGMHIILQQKQIYQKWNKKQQTTHHLLKKIYQVKIPGLNSILQRWQAPNGVNIFKQSMKKRFHQQGTRPYFELRPIDPQFLQYSAQDVQDLIDVYQNMKKQDNQKLSEVIGQIYSNYQ